MSICYSFRNYISNNFGEKMKQDAAEYCHQIISQNSGFEPDPSEVQIVNYHWVTTVGVGNYVYFQLFWKCLLYCSEQYEFLNSYRINLNNDSLVLEMVDMPDGEDYVILDEYLIPEMSFAEPDAVANELISHVYKADIPQSGLINPVVFANKLNLTIREFTVPQWTENIMGAIVLEPTEIVVTSADYKQESHKLLVEAGTIIINQKTKEERGSGAVNNTIIHECIHKLLHWRLQRFLRIQDSCCGGSIYCSNTTSTDDNVVYTIMEQQANHLAPRILMPLYPFKKAAENAFSRARELTGGKEADVDLIDSQVIPFLAEHFGVSIMSAKIRLREIGFSISAGAKVFVDNAYLRPFAFEEDSLKHNETYTLSKQNYHELMEQDSSFQAAMSSGTFIFAENHVVINSAKSIQYSGTTPLLTEFARLHLDKFALKFSVQRKTAVQTEPTNLSCLQRLPVVTASEILSFFPGNSKEIMQCAEKKMKQWLEFYNNSPNSWNKTILNIMKEQEMNRTSLASKCGLDYEKLRRCLALNKDSDITKRMFTVICLVLDIPFCVSEKLINNIGYIAFDLAKREDRCYQTLLMGYIGQPLDVCNEYLINNDLEPFTDELPVHEEKKLPRGMGMNQTLRA